MERVHPKIQNTSEIVGSSPNYMGSRSKFLLTDDQIVQRIESRVFAQPNTVTFADANASEPSTKFMVVSRTSVIDMSESYISLRAAFAGAANDTFAIPNNGHPLITSINIRLNNTEIYNAQNYELISGFMANYYGAYQTKSEIMGVLAGSPAIQGDYYGDLPNAALAFGRLEANAALLANNQQSRATKLSKIMRSRLCRITAGAGTPNLREIRIYLSSIPVFNELMHSSDFPLFAVDNLEINVRFAALQKCYTALTDAFADAALGNAVTCTYSDICLVLSQKIVSDFYRSNILMRLESGLLIASLNIDYRSGTPDASNNLQIVVVPNLSHVLSGVVFFSKRGVQLSAANSIPHTEIYYPFGIDNNATSAIFLEQEAGTTQVRFSVGGVLIPQYPITSIAQRVSNFYDALKAVGIEPTYANYDQMAYEKVAYGVSMLKSASPKAMRLSGINISRGLSFEATFSGGTAYTNANVVNVQYNVLLSYIQIMELFNSGPIISR